MTLDLNTVANIVSMLQLPATLVTLAGYIAAMTDTGHKWLRQRLALPVIFVVIVLALAFGDLVLHVYPSLFQATTLDTVLSRQFQNETVKVDGKEFINCTFTDVTFRYDGGLYKFTNSRVALTKVGFFSADQKINYAFGLINALHLLAPTVQMEIRPGSDLR
jgi:hypothetical protein